MLREALGSDQDRVDDDGAPHADEPQTLEEAIAALWTWGDDQSVGSDGRPGREEL